MLNVRAKIPSPAIAFVGRHNSGKTTLIEKIVYELTSSGLDVATIKHHTHGDFVIDVVGKDSYRHKKAGASEVVIASPTKLARISDVEGEVECNDIVDTMYGHDIIVIEGYRHSGIPYVEVMRKDNQRDVDFSISFINDLKSMYSKKQSEILPPKCRCLSNANLNFDLLAFVISDISEVEKACKEAGIEVFDFCNIEKICSVIRKNHVRKKVSLVIQAGGESKRMGRPKEQLKIDGEYVIEKQIERFLGYVDEVVVTSNHPERLSYLKDNYSLPVKICGDLLEKKGALTGMHTAFSKSVCERVCCIACDMVFASEKLLAKQIQIMDATHADVVIPVNKHGYEPFHALYFRKHCLDAVEVALKNNDCRAQSFLEYENLNVYEMPQSEVREVVPRGGCFLNINTPDDLHRLFSKEELKFT